MGPGSVGLLLWARTRPAPRAAGAASTRTHTIPAPCGPEPMRPSVQESVGVPDQRVRRPRRIGVIPAYNEESTVRSVLEHLYELVDEVVVVEDGSTDDTRG